MAVKWLRRHIPQKHFTTKRIWKMFFELSLEVNLPQTWPYRSKYSVMSLGAC